MWYINGKARISALGAFAHLPGFQYKDTLFRQVSRQLACRCQARKPGTNDHPVCLNVSVQCGFGFAYR